MKESMLECQGKESNWSDIVYRIDEIYIMITTNEESDTIGKLDAILNVVKLYNASLDVVESVDNETFM